jgi:hypothetical protein
MTAAESTAPDTCGQTTTSAAARRAIALLPRAALAYGGAMPRPKAIAAALLPLALLGCSSGAASRAAEELQGGDPHAPPPDAPAVPEPPPGSPPEQVLDHRALKFAHGLTADDPALTGTLDEGGRRDLLMVLRAPYCYRILGVGAESVQDMDLFLYDPNGVQTHQDPAQDRFPLLGKQSDICPPVSGKYRLQVHMYKGGGEYAVRAFRTPM